MKVFSLIKKKPLLNKCVNFFPLRVVKWDDCSLGSMRSSRQITHRSQEFAYTTGKFLYAGLAFDNGDSSPNSPRKNGSLVAILQNVARVYWARRPGVMSRAVHQRLPCLLILGRKFHFQLSSRAPIGSQINAARHVMNASCTFRCSVGGTIAGFAGTSSVDGVLPCFRQRGFLFLILLLNCEYARTV